MVLFIVFDCSQKLAVLVVVATTQYEENDANI
jgi:hypothetical protein